MEASELCVNIERGAVAVDLATVLVAMAGADILDLAEIGEMKIDPTDPTSAENAPHDPGARRTSLPLRR